MYRIVFYFFVSTLAKTKKVFIMENKEYENEEDAVEFAKKNDAYVYASWNKQCQKITHIVTEDPTTVDPATWRVW